MIGNHEEMKFAYDGKQVVIYNITGNTWSSVNAPATIDQTMDMLANRYGMALPLVDLLFSDPYKDLSARLRSGVYLGTGYGSTPNVITSHSGRIRSTGNCGLKTARTHCRAKL